MRLTSLQLQRYGNFETQTLTFDPSPGVINLVVAPNGAGKSVLRGAFCDLLFGIGGQTPMGFRYGYNGMRISAEGIGPDGQPFAFGRRKGQGNTLIDAAGEPLDAGAIASLLGRTDRVLLERLFALDTERLRQGESDLLASNGALADVLEAGAGGFRHARRLRQALEAERDAMAPMRKSAQRPFYVQLDRFTEARRRLSAGALRPDHWEKQARDLADAEQRQIEQNALADSASREIARLERIRRVTPWFTQRDTAAAWLAEHPDAPHLDPALKPRLDTVRTDIVLAEQRLRTDTERAALLAAQIEAVTVDVALLAEADSIDAVTDRAGAARKATDDLPARSAELESRQTRITALLADLGRTLPVERASEAVPSRAVIANARRLIGTHAARLQAVQAEPPRIAASEHEAADLAAKLTDLPLAEDRDALADMVKEIRADGDPARQARQFAADLAAATAAVTVALARVPGWAGETEALLVLRPLQRTQYDRLAEDRRTAASQAVTATEQVESARQALTVARDQLAVLERNGPLPDETGLEHARARRDAGWQLIYRRGFTADPPSLSEEQAFTGPLPLPIAFERAIVAADTVADRRVSEAAAVEQARSARQTVENAKARLHAAENAYRLAVETSAATDRAWTQVCAPLPLGPVPSVREVEDFIAARAAVIEAWEKQREARDTHAALGLHHAGWAERLAEALEMPADQELAALLAAADRRLAAAQQAVKARASLEAKREATDKALAEALTRAREAAAALLTWQEAWNRLLPGLGRPADEDPAVTEELLQVIADLDKARNEAVSLAERVAGMTADNGRFREMVAALAGRVAPELGGTDPFQAVQDLRRRLERAREQNEQRRVLSDQRAAASAQAAETERGLAARQAELRAVLLLTGAETVDEADMLLALAAERATHAVTLEEAERRLREAGDGLPLETLRADIASLSPDEIAAEIDRLGRARAAAQEAAQEAAAMVSTLRQLMEREAEETTATDAAADQQAAAASIGRVLDDALVLHTAAEMLGQALVSVEESGGTAVLRRIGTLFGMLTSGSYVGVRAEVDDDGTPRLILLQRDYPDERQSVKDLSEGTRDQLFLALRLASIEAHVERASPLPFIGDDILQTFDDDRAVAALQVLCEVNPRAQVILLTHHRHVADLAARLPSGTVRTIWLAQ